MFLILFASPSFMYCSTKVNALAGTVASVVVFTLLDDNWLNAIKSSDVATVAGVAPDALPTNI